jgi:threonine/homoserine/homoserine lactone efflux protein
MLELLVLLKSIVVGFAIAAPPGPVAAMCLGSTLRDGRRHGFVLGASVALADTSVALLVALGLGAILTFIEHERLLVQLCGGMIVALFGVLMFRSRPKVVKPQLATGRAARLFITGFGITLTNPMTYGAFAAVISALGILGKDAGLVHVAVIAVGIFIGSMIWWTALVLCAGFFRRWLDEQHIRWIHHILGIALITLGLIASALAAYQLLTAG